jgi:predicted transcriptional regulator
MTDRRAPRQTQIRLTEEQRDRLSELAARWECPLNAAVARAVSEALEHERFRLHERISEAEIRAMGMLKKKRTRAG